MSWLASLDGVTSVISLASARPPAIFLPSLLSGVMTGWLAEQGWNGRRTFRAFMSMLLGNAVCLAFGAAWLAAVIGLEQAIMYGVAPFLVGAVLKSALGAAVLALFMRGKTRAAE